MSQSAGQEGGVLILKKMGYKEYNDRLHFGAIRKLKADVEARKDYEEITRTFKQIVVTVGIALGIFYGVKLIYWIANVVLPFWWLKI